MSFEKVLRSSQDEDFHVIYINEVLDRKDWHTFEVGKTRFNDEAVRQAGWFLAIWMLGEKGPY